MAESHPRISVVTICYNQRRFVGEAIASVLNQGYPNLEYIVVDAGSTDGSREVIESKQHRLSKIIFEPDLGPADGLKKGFSHATGELFGFLNADDVLINGSLFKIAQFFQTNDNADVVVGHSLVIDEHGKPKRRLFSDRYSLKMAAHGACVISQPSTFFRASSYARSSGFNVNNRISWDYELWADMALSGARFTRIDALLSKFRVYDDSITGSGRGRKEGAACNKILRRRIYTEAVGKAPPAYFFLSCLIARYVRKIAYPRDTLERIRKGSISR